MRHFLSLLTCPLRFLAATQPSPPVRLLLIDNAQSFAQTLQTLLRRDGYHVDTVPSGPLAWAHLQQHAYELVCCDLPLPQRDGPPFLTTLAQLQPHVHPRVLFLTCTTFDLASQQFLEQCGHPWLRKPFPMARLRPLVQQLLQCPSAPLLP